MALGPLREENKAVIRRANTSSMPRDLRENASRSHQPRADFLCEVATPVPGTQKSGEDLSAHCNKTANCVLAGEMALQGGGTLDLRSIVSLSSCPLGPLARGREGTALPCKELSLSIPHPLLYSKRHLESCHILPMSHQLLWAPAPFSFTVVGPCTHHLARTLPPSPSHSAVTAVAHGSGQGSGVSPAASHTQT